MAKKMDLGAFVKVLNRVVGHNPNDKSTPHVVENPSFNECSCRGLLAGDFYVCGISHYHKNGKILKKKVEEKIIDYTKRSRLNFIVTEDAFCGDNECHGHYVDPFKTLHRENIFVNSFPKDLSGVYV